MTPDPADVEAVARARCKLGCESPDGILGCSKIGSCVTWHAYIEDAEILIAALVERGWTPPIAPSSGAQPPADKAGE